MLRPRAVERRVHRGRLAQKLLAALGVEAVGTESEPGARDRGVRSTKWLMAAGQGAHAVKLRGGALSAQRKVSQRGSAALQIGQHAGRVLEGTLAERVLAD
jgi:hypothetical protein